MSNGDQTGASAGDGLAICASVMGLLIVLVILRYGLNLFLDVFILGNLDEVKRSMVEVWRRICPWWHRRTLPSDFTGAATPVRPPTLVHGVRPSHGGSAETVQQTVERNSSKLTVVDLQAWRDQHFHADLEAAPKEAAENDNVDLSVVSAMVCSICLHDFCEDEMVFRASCRHIFHADCMAEWLKNSGMDCPYCRRAIISSREDERGP